MIQRQMKNYKVGAVLIFRYLPKGVRMKHETVVQSGDLLLGRDLNPEPPEYGSQAVRLK
jgi:hypothetical protein